MRDQPGLVVQRPQHRHRGHRRAVRVGDDALGPLARPRPGSPRRPRAARPGPSARPTSCRSPRRRPRRPAARTPCELPLPAENSTMSRPRKSAVSASSTVTSPSPHGRVRPAERAEAKSRSWSTGNWRSARMRRMTPPTCPVAPTMPILMATKLRPDLHREKSVSDVCPIYRGYVLPHLETAGRSVADMATLHPRASRVGPALAPLAHRRKFGGVSAAPAEIRRHRAGRRLRPRHHHRRPGDA